MLRLIRRAVMIATVVLLGGLASNAAGILPDRQNKIIIQGQFGNTAPSFLLVFSTLPVKDARGSLVSRVPAQSLTGLKSDRDHLVLRVYGKQPTRSGQVEYAFGTTADATMAWNNGDEFRWEDWRNYSPDIWDNLCVLSLPETGNQARVTGAAIFKGGKALYDSRTRASYPNRRPFDASFPSIDLSPQRGEHPVLNLAEKMEEFRREYYELGKSRVLQFAYSDLGQTDKQKYANRGNAWCSEFSSYVYRQCGISTPDPNLADVHWRTMREFFERNGQVYPAREVATWSDERKRATIKPGSFVSILIGEATHSIIFTTWVAERGQPISKYVGVSGNNKGMVWSHSPLKLPTPEVTGNLTPEALRDYDQKVYFAVPAGSP